MNINYVNAKKLVMILHEYFLDEKNIAEVEYPSQIQCGTKEWLYYIFYSCLLDYGMKSKIYHNNLINTYNNYIGIFNPNNVLKISADELKDIIINNIHPRYPNVAVNKWIKLSNELVKYDDLFCFISSFTSFNELNSFIKRVGYGQKTGGLLLRLIYDSGICNFEDDINTIPLDRHDIEISLLNGIIDKDKLNSNEIKELSSAFIKIGKELNISPSTIDKYLWETGNKFCTKKDCLNCPLYKMCLKKGID